MSLKFPKKSCVLLGSVLLALLLSGCGAQRIIWSPDGKQAVLLCDDGMRLCDAEGRVSGLLSSNAVVSVAWFQDSTKLAMISGQTFTSWKQAEPELDDATRQRIAQMAAQVIARLKSGTDLKSALDGLGIDHNEQNSVAVYLKDSPDIKNWITNWAEFEKGDATILILSVGTVADGALASVKDLTKSLATPVPMSLRVSPNGGGILYTTGDAATRLWVIPSDGAAREQVVCDESCSFPDWCPDNRSIAYIRAIGLRSTNDDLRLGCLTRRVVFGSGGEIMLQTNQDLAGVLFDPSLGVRCLPDGRILFTAMDVHLPVTAQGIPDHPEVFLYDSAFPASVPRVVPQSAEQNLRDARFIVPSPDGKKLLMADNKDGVSVLTFATGDVTTVEKNDDSEAPSFPSWRGEEVCLTVPGEIPGHKWEVELWHPGEKRLISTNWPEEVRKTLLDGK